METNVQQAYDDADLARAIQAYKFFYPTVSGAAIVKGNEQIGVVPNKVFGILDCAPEQLVFTANSDTPYGPLLLDLAHRPAGRRAAAGPLIVCSMDINQRWVADMGLPGPDAGKGGKHLLLGPDYEGQVPATATTCTGPAATGRSSAPARCRSTATWKAAKERLTTIKVYPLNPTDGLDGAAVARRHRQDAGHHAAAVGRQLHSSGRCCTRRSTPSRPSRATTTTTANSRRSASRRANRSRPDAPHEGDSRGSGRGGQRADARAIVRRSPARPRRRGRIANGSGRPCVSRTATSTPPTHVDLGRAREVVLSGDRRVAGDVPPRHAGRVAVLAGPARQHRRRISTAARPTSSPCRCRCRASCSGR